MQHCHTAHVTAGDNDNDLAFRACGEDPKQDSSNDQPPPQETGRIVACGYFSITDPARSQLHCWSNNVKMIAQAAGLCNQVWSPCFEVSGRDCELCHQVHRCNGQEWDLEEGCYTPASMHQVDVFVDLSFSFNHEPFRSVSYYLMEERQFHGHQGDIHCIQYSRSKLRSSATQKINNRQRA